MCLWAPSSARANGDPASDYLLTQSMFLPFTTKIDRTQVTRLGALLGDAGRKHYRIRTAIILSPSDLGTAFSLFDKPQKYAQFLGLELSFVYRDRLLVVMPNGFGYSVNGKRRPETDRVLRSIQPPGSDATKGVEAATAAITRLAAAKGHRIVVPRGEGSQATDRITIAATATACLALIAGAMLYRRQRRSSRT